MYEILNIFKTIFNFVFDFMNVPINIYGVEFTLWSVFIFVLLGSLLLWVVQAFYGTD